MIDQIHNPMKAGFSEDLKDGREEYSHMEAEVCVGRNGDWISVITDAYEGHAMMTLPLAEKVHESLGRAIEFARRARGL